MAHRPGYLPGTPGWALKFVLSDVIATRPTGRPGQRRRGPRGLAGVPDRPGRRPLAPPPSPDEGSE